MSAQSHCDRASEMLVGLHVWDYLLTGACAHGGDAVCFVLSAC